MDAITTPPVNAPRRSSLYYRPVGPLPFMLPPPVARDADVAPAPLAAAIRATPPPVIVTRATRAPAEPLPVGAVAIGRKSFDGATFIGVPNAILPPDSPEDTWQLQKLDEEALRRFSPARLMQLLTELSPEVSRALYDYLRLFNPGYEIKALYPGKDTPFPRAQVKLDSYLKIIAQQRGNGTLDVAMHRIAIAGWLRGALFSEAVFDAGYRFAGMVFPDPITVRFRTKPDPVFTWTWELGQLQPWIAQTTTMGAGGFVSLEYPNIAYIPVDPFPGSPYGRPLCTAALFTALFLLALLHDLRRVVAQQGYPRLDVELVLEQLRLAMPPEDQDDTERMREWVDNSIQEVQNTLTRLQPDDTYVHTDVIKVNRPVGTVDASNLQGFGVLIERLEASVTRALKTMPLAMGTTNAMSEANANRQWELLASGIRSFQHAAENMLGDQLSLALRFDAGLLADVQVRFAQLRKSEELRDEQARTLRFKNLQVAEQMNWMTHDEASMEAVGHPAVGPAQPVATNADLGGQTNNNPDAATAMGTDTPTGEQNQ